MRTNRSKNLQQRTVVNNGEPQSIGEVFLEQHRAQPDSSALSVSLAGRLEVFSWRDIALLVSNALEQFHVRDIRTGAHVATWLPSGLAWVVIDLACQLRGAVHVALDARLPCSTALALAEHAEAQLLLAPEDLLLERPSSALQRLPRPLTFDAFMGGPSLDLARSTATADHARATGRLEETLTGRADLPAHPQAAAQILYTSGTMSQPKGVVLSHRNLLSNARAKLAAAPQYPTDVRLNVLPFAHAYARTCELSTWLISGSQLCIARDWPDFLQLAPRIRPTLINLVPHLAQKLVTALDEIDETAGAKRAGERLLGERLRLLQVGGAALQPAVWNRLAQVGWPPLQGYGLTEASPVICSNRAGDQRPDSVGMSVPGVELRVDERGVLWTRGPHVMLEYWKAPADTAIKIQDGWLCTGDLAEATADGRWRIIGRADDQITLSTGYTASPHELARRFADDPWIEQLVIVGQDRPHLAALVYPRLSELPSELFESRGPGPCGGLQPEQLSATRFERALVQRWAAAQADLPRQLRIERVGLLHEKLASENGGLNFKGAVRRKFVEHELLADQVAKLYR